MPIATNLGEGLRQQASDILFSSSCRCSSAELNRRGVKTFVELGSYPDPGIRLCIIQDNNGNLIEFVTPL